MSPLASVVLVSYNTRDLLRQALRSVLDSARGRYDLECIVVDNASADGSPEIVAEEFPSVTLLRNTENRGFAAGVNRALECAAGEYLLLLNPDAELLEQSLDRMLDFMSRHPGVAAVGPRLMYGDGTPQDAAFSFPTLPMIFLDFFPLHGRLLGSRLNGRYPGTASPRPIGHPLGACMLVRHESLRDVGPFDERFFMYCEEVDWCLRAWKKGWLVYHLPDVAVRHLAGQSTRQTPGRMFVELHRSRLLLYRKHYPRWFRMAARAITSAGLWAEARRARRAAAEGALQKDELADRLWAIEAVRRLLREDRR